MPPLSPVTFDAQRLRPGRFVYRLAEHGHDFGDATIEIRPLSDGTCRLSLSSRDIGQHWSAVVRRDFTPVEAQLAMTQGESSTLMSLAYEGSQVGGTLLVGGSRRSVSARLAGQVIDQRVDWAAMMAAQSPDGVEFGFGVYDAESGVSPLIGRATSAASVAAVMGQRPTLRLEYRILKGPHTEAYVVYTTRSAPRVMLREDMPGGLSATLVSAA